MPNPTGIFDPKIWKVTLPVGAKNRPTELAGAELVAYSSDWMKLLPAGGMQFRAPVNGVTTSGSGYPRSELREENADGSLASWSPTDGKTHTLVVDEAVTRIPNPRTSGNSATVSAQIHDGSNDISVFRVEAGQVWVTQGNTTHFALADGNYVPGTRFKAMYTVANGIVTAFYNGQKIISFAAKGSAWFFKTGAYVQANASNSSPGDATNYGETILYSVQVAHGSPVPAPGPVPVPVPVPDPIPTPAPVPVPTPVPPVSGPVVILRRHAEKPAGSLKGYTDPSGKTEDAHSLTLLGWQRAKGLVSEFTAPRSDLFRPTRIYAADGPVAGARMTETVSFLAPALGLTTITRFDKGAEAALAAELKSLTPGQVALVCWEHSAIGVIAKAFGAKISWPDPNFNGILIFTGDGKGKWSFRETAELILPTDKAIGLDGKPVAVGTTPVPPPVPVPVPTPPPVPVPVPPPAPQFPDPAWWAKYAPKGSAVYAAVLAAIAAALIAAGVACGTDCLPGTTPPPVPPPTSSPAPTPVPTPNAQQVQITWYGSYDNDPQGSLAIDHPVIHKTAGGVGTYADPLTFASPIAPDGSSAYAYGARIYVPSVQKYFIREDSCATSWTAPNGCGALTHVDLYIGNPSATVDVLKCEDALTPNGLAPIQLNPPADLPVDAAPMWVESSKTCHTTPVPTSAPAPTSTPTSTPVPPPGRVYPVHTNIVSTTFWVGEIFDPKIPDGSQVCSAYDSQWAYHWSGVKTGTAGSGTDCAGSPTGGCDGVPGTGKCATEARHPENGYFPTHTNVVPHENPFYLDLPFDDVNDATALKTRCTVIPWANDGGKCSSSPTVSYMKNRWVRIVGPNGNTCYGQVEDAGPSHGSLYHDAAYVFGSNDARPVQGQFNDAGLDSSPALNGCLGFAELDGENDHVKWQFVDAPPPGPWTKLVTTSGVTP